MIEKEFFGLVVECDKCSNYYNHDNDDFSDAIAEIKKKGWKIRKNNDEWEHICPTCLEAGK